MKATRVAFATTFAVFAVALLAGSTASANAPLRQGPSVTAVESPSGDLLVDRAKNKCHRRKKGHGFPKRCRRLPSSAGAARGDFNGDNIGDLAIGFPSEDVGNDADSGSVLIIYGSGSGLSTSHAPLLLNQDTPGALGTAETNDKFGSALAAGDFDKDGFSDLAVMAVGENSDNPRTISGTVNGAIQLFFGSSSGKMVGNKIITGASLETAEGFPALGDSLAWGDFDGDETADLAVELGGLGNDIQFAILFGGTGGLSGDRRATRFTSITSPSSHPHTMTLAAGDMNGGSVDGGIDDLIIGVPWAVGRGEVAAFYGTTNRGTTLKDGDTVAGPNKATTTTFGSSVALGDVDADGLADLAIGNQFGGSVSVISGTVDGLDASAQAATFPNPPGENEFGRSIVFADFNGDGFDDIAIGSPRAIGSSNVGLGETGNVRVCDGADIPGLFASSSCEVWTQDSPGIPGTRETFDTFGDAVSAWNFGGSSQADLAITVPQEDVSSGGTNIKNAGAIAVIYGSKPGGLSSAGSQLWHQGSPGVPGSLESEDGRDMSTY